VNRLRVAVVATMAAFPIAVAAVSALAETPLTIILPYKKGAFEAVIESLTAPLTRHLGRDVVVEHVADDGGWAAIEALRASPPGDAVLADAELTLAVKQEIGGRDFTFDQLTPVAKITDGLSVALIAPASADYGSWEGLRAESAERSLTLASTGPHSAYGVAEALLVKVLGSGFKEVRESGPQAIFEAVASGKAELGLVTTNRLEGMNAAGSATATPVVTFGAKRSPRYLETPTLAEVSGNDRNDFTFALGLFGHPDMPAEVGTAIYEALLAAEADPEIVDAPIHADIPLNVNDAQVLREAFERDLRVLKRLEAY
jgi:tripartite-type tricarboxylate transporter receptor subunit TctC